MEMAEYIIFGFCILGVGYIHITLIPEKEWIKVLEWVQDLCGKNFGVWVNHVKEILQLEQLNLREMNMGVYDMHTIPSNNKRKTKQQRRAILRKNGISGFKLDEHNVVREVKTKKTLVSTLTHTQERLQNTF